MIQFTENTFTVYEERSLLISEIERKIKEYAKEHSLKLPSAFCRLDYEFYSHISPNTPFIQFKIVFQARPKTPDEILGEQIEFQIKQLQS